MSHTYAELLATPFEELAKTLKTYHRTKTRFSNLREKLTEDTPSTGKVMAAFKVAYAKKTDTGELPKGTSFAEYYSNVFGSKPDGKVEQCAVAFNGYVLTGKITEDDYDLVAADWLQKAGTILNEVKNDLNHEKVIMAARILKQRGKNGAKELRLIIAELKGKATDASGKTLTPDDVAEQVTTFMESGFGQLVLTCIKMHVKDKVRNADQSEAKDLYQASQSIMHQWEDAGFDAETVTDWFQDWDNKQNAHQPAIVTKPDYRQIAIDFYGTDEMDQDMIQDVAKEIEGFHLAKGRLPKSSQEFDAYMEGSLVQAVA